MLKGFKVRVRLPHKTLVLSLAVALGGCASISPEALKQAELAASTQADSNAMLKDVEPLPAALSMDEAIARALKYNLDRRTRLMEESLALGQLDVAQFDMLPKLLAQAGYMWRDTDRISYSANSQTLQRSDSTPFISQDPSIKPFSLDGCHALMTDGPQVREFHPRWYRAPVTG